jgi:hypothetical protein
MRNGAQTNGAPAPPPELRSAAMVTRSEWLTKLQASPSAGPGIRYLRHATRTFLRDPAKFWINH